MITEVSRITGIPALDILERRENYICEVRQLYWMLLRMHGYSYSHIARLCGRTHSTVILGIRHIEGLMRAGHKGPNDLWEKIKHIKK